VRVWMCVCVCVCVCVLGINNNSIVFSFRTYCYMWIKIIIIIITVKIELKLRKKKIKKNTPICIYYNNAHKLHARVLILLNAGFWRCDFSALVACPVIKVDPARRVCRRGRTCTPEVALCYARRAWDGGSDGVRAV
jgi:hypothetical protein